MAQRWRTKTFKSGNSVALRLPKGTGLKEGDDMIIVPHDGGKFSFWREADALEVLMSLYGSMSPGFMKDGRGDTEQADRDWDHEPKRSAA
jgi:antitoxin VapB